MISAILRAITVMWLSWFKVLPWKGSDSVMGPWVRIPPSPPNFYGELYVDRIE